GVTTVESYIRPGKYARLPELPYTPGNDGAGVIEQVGPDVSQVKAGDRVYTAGSISGTYAEFALCKKGPGASIAGKCFVRARGGDWHAVRDGVSRAVAARRCQAGRNGVGARRQRRGRDGGGATGACSRSARARHRGQ